MPAILGLALLALGSLTRFGVSGTGVAEGIFNIPASIALYAGGILLVFGCAYSLPRWAQQRQTQQVPAGQDPIAAQVDRRDVEVYVIDLRTSARKAEPVLSIRPPRDQND